MTRHYGFYGDYLHVGDCVCVCYLYVWKEMSHHTDSESYILYVSVVCFSWKHHYNQQSVGGFNAYELMFRQSPKMLVKKQTVLLSQGL